MRHFEQFSNIAKYNFFGFQEARRICIAVYQHVIYSEYIPTVIGRKMAAAYGLLPSRGQYFNGYTKSLDPRLTNEFVVGAFRFGHSQITGDVRYSAQCLKITEKVSFDVASYGAPFTFEWTKMIQKCQKKVSFGEFLKKHAAKQCYQTGQF